MKRITIATSTILVFLAQALFVFSGQMSSDVEQYLKKVQPLLQKPGNSDTLNGFLRSCLEGAGKLKGYEAYMEDVTSVFDELVKERLEWTDQLAPGDSGNTVTVAEQDAYEDHLLPYRKAEYVNLTSLQDELLSRKYFECETSKNANFFEGLINSRCPLTRTDRGDPKTVLGKPNFGVRSWEAIVRVEPAVAYDDGADGVQAVLLGTLGMTKAFFPAVVRDGEKVTFDESLCSKVVRKFGLRIGAGGEMVGDSVDFVAGAGVQVWAVSFWGLYKPDDSSVMFAVGASDLSKLKKIVGWFD